MPKHKEQFQGNRPARRPVPLQLRLIRFVFSTLGGLFPRLVGRQAFNLWFRTRRFPESAAGKRAARNARHEVMPVNSVPVAISRWGNSGPRILFIHGWSGRGNQVAAFLQPLLAAGCQVVAVDGPGHGDTPGDKTNILECARVVQAANKEYGPFHGAITHSFGGMVLAYALQHGMRVNRAVCISAPADVAFLLENFAQTLCMHPKVVSELDRLLDLRFESTFREQVSTVNNVRNLDVPALVIHDEQDSSVPIEQGRRIAEAWPNARLMQTSGLGHGRILRDAEVVAAAVAFIADDIDTAG